MVHQVAILVTRATVNLVVTTATPVQLLDLRTKPYIHPYQSIVQLAEPPTETTMPVPTMKSLTATLDTHLSSIRNRFQLLPRLFRVSWTTD